MKRFSFFRVPRLALALCIINAAVFLLTLPRVCADFYVLNIFPAIENIFARVSGILPFSVGEVLLFFILPSWVVFEVVLFLKGRGRFSRVFTVALVLCLSFQLGCGINYRRTPLIFHLTDYGTTLPVQYGRDDVVRLIGYLSDELESLPDEQGGYSAAQIRETAAAILPRTYVPPPKMLITSPLYSLFNISGVYSPFTYEANVNYMVPENEKPFVIAHELSHLSGFMREDEANYMAFEICVSSNNTAVRFSGYVSALAYALGECYYLSNSEELFEEYVALVEGLKNRVPAAIAALRERDAFWSRYDSPIARFSEIFNNMFLVVNGVEEGVSSYSEVVDLLIHRLNANDV
ncbi:zinc-binding protein [Clostridia bacterium]|nr:zinc-binding protein [Clostridia bacterium]